MEKIRSESDRRLAVTRITPEGLTLLDALKPVVDGMLDRLGERLSPADCEELSRLCEALYADDHAAAPAERKGEPP